MIAHPHRRGPRPEGSDCSHDMIARCPQSARPCLAIRTLAAHVDSSGPRDRQNGDPHEPIRRIHDPVAHAILAGPCGVAPARRMRPPPSTIYAIDVSFAALNDKAELDYLNELTTSFYLPEEAVDRLRAAAGKAIMALPDFQRLLKDAGARIVTSPPRAGEATAGPAREVAHRIPFPTQFPREGTRGLTPCRASCRYRRGGRPVQHRRLTANLTGREGVILLESPSHKMVK
jgi:hypothetical protein